MKYFFGLLAIIVTSLPYFAVAGMSSDGPSASDLKAAMINMGIKAGAAFEFGGKSYTLHNINVSKSGTNTYVVSLTTVEK